MVNIISYNNEIREDASIVRNVYEIHHSSDPLDLVLEDIQTLKHEASDAKRRDVAEAAEELREAVASKKAQDTSVREFLEKIKGEALDFVKEKAQDTLRKFLGL